MLEQLVLALLNETQCGATVPSNGLFIDNLVRLIALRLLREHSA